MKNENYSIIYEIILKIKTKKTYFEARKKKKHLSVCSNKTKCLNELTSYVNLILETVLFLLHKLHFQFAETFSDFSCVTYFFRI